MPTDFWRALALLVLFGGAAWAIRRAGDRLRADLGDKSGKKQTGLTKEEIDAIVSNGLATPETLFAMSAKEQKLLAVTALSVKSAGARRGSHTAE